MAGKRKRREEGGRRSVLSSCEGMEIIYGVQTRKEIESENKNKSKVKERDEKFNVRNPVKMRPRVVISEDG